MVVDVLYGVLQFPAPAPGLRFDAAHHGRCRLQIRLRAVDGRLLHSKRGLIGLLIQFNEKLALVHTVVVVDEHPRNLTPDAGGDERHVIVHECVVRRYGVESQPYPGNTEPKGGCQDQDAQPSEQHLSLPRNAMNVRGGWPGSTMWLLRGGVASNRTTSVTCRRRVGRI